MPEQIAVGSIIEGKVTRITDFGAIVSIGSGKQGLVHISQVADTFVQNINDHVKINDIVKVKVLSIDEEKNRIALSIRDALPKAEKEKANKSSFKAANKSLENETKATNPVDDFEEKMKQFLKQSNDKMASLNKRANKRQ